MFEWVNDCSVKCFDKALYKYKAILADAPHQKRITAK